VLGDFHRAHPGVEIILTEHHNEQLQKRWPAATPRPRSSGSPASRAPPHVRARVIAAEPLVLAVRPDHPLARRATVGFGQLSNCP
jgi:DNA-binding transcriptional LysR family regulator